MHDLVDYSRLSEFEIRELLIKDPNLIIDRIPQTEERCIVALQQSGMLLRFVSKYNQTLKMCLAAVSNCGFALEYVPRRLLCRELFFAAIKKDGRAIFSIPRNELDDELILAAIQSDASVLKYLPRYVPDYKIPIEFIEEAISRDGLALDFLEEKQRSTGLCKVAVAQNPLALEYVPEKKKTKTLCISAFQRNYQAMRYIPERFLTEKMCKAALSDNPMLLRFVPEIYKTKERCIAILQREYNTILYIPREYLEFSDYEEVLNKYVQCICEDSEEASLQKTNLAHIVSEWPSDIVTHCEITAICRKLGVIETITKKYDRERNAFVVSEKFATWDSEVRTQEFDNFHAFYVYLNGDMNGADLFNYDFEGIDLSKYLIDGAYIKSDILIKYGLYDSSYYERTVRFKNGLNSFVENQSECLLPPEAILHESDFDSVNFKSNRKLYYISDIHIDQKLFQAFPQHATHLEIKYFVENIARRILNSAQDRGVTDYLLIAGDTSYSYEISKIFYSYLASKWRNIIVTIGNHELWDCSIDSKTQSKEWCINRYRSLFKELGIIFLHNDLLIVDNNEKKHVIKETELKKSTCEEMDNLRRNLFNRSRMVVLGSLGYSGYNPTFNASNGLYRDAIQTIEDDIRETEYFEDIYNKLYNGVHDYPVVVLTHTPREDWSTKGYNENWIYVNGHTHKNQFFCDEHKTVYSDNQIGYHSLNCIALKFFQLKKNIDIFWDYPNGIYTITREQYLTFNRGMQIQATFIRTKGKFYMLKREGIYCFIYEDEKGKHLLDGGNLKTLNHHDLAYYYVRLPLYAAVVRNTFQQYYLLLDKISQAVKMFGGDGTIHGGIIDISFFTHLYVDPEKLTITPYFAWSKSGRKVYPSVEELLLEQSEKMYGKYVSLKKLNSASINLLESLNNSQQNKLAKYEYRTEMYKLSELVRKVQYIVEKNVIRIWDETIFENGNPSIGSGALIESKK